MLYAVVLRIPVDEWSELKVLGIYTHMAMSLARNETTLDVVCECEQRVEKRS